jgi:hypothetical protein
MAFDLGGTVNATADWFCNAPLVRGVVNNPIFTALLITALVVVVTMALYIHQIKQAGLKKGLRAVLYIFILVLGVVFVHHRAVSCAAQRGAAQQGVRDVFSSIEQSRRFGGGAVPVRLPSDSVDDGLRRDNVASIDSAAQKSILDDDDLFDIEDVVVPAARGAFAAL